MKIAISVSAEEKAKGSTSAYFQALVEAGARPEELQLVAAEDAAALRIDDYDGLLLAGGRDVDPALYQEGKSHESVRVDRARDDFELKVLDRALNRRVPVFGICRGAQVINVKFNGTLFQDLNGYRAPEDERAPIIEHKQQGDRTSLVHSVTVTDPNSCLAQVLPGSFPVNSLHHQGIKRLGRGLKVTAHAEDGLVEAVEAADGSYLVAVQWHPEELVAHAEQKLLIAQFIEACRANEKRRNAARA